MNWLLAFFLVTLTCCESALLNADGKELIFLQFVFRNGMSAPRELYPNDPNHPDQWEEGMGELTIHGRRQLYALGKDLRKRYSHFITANPREVTMQVATNPKGMRSGLSLLASLYAPTEEWEFVPGLPWQPVPVFYLPEDEDKVLVPFRSCPLVVQRLQKLVGQYGNETVLEMYEQQMKFWSLNSGLPINDWNDVVNLHRILSTEYANKHNVPAWAWKYWKELVCLNDYAYKINFNDNKILKVVGGPIFNHLVDNALEKIKGEFESTRVMAFSGQSTHVAGLLGALKAFNDKEPPFASIVVMELFKDNKNDAFVRWLFRNETDLQVLKIPGCQEFCTMEHMHEQAMHYESTKWGLDCRGPPAALDQLKELLRNIQI
ncbi:testicular acid phosphatase homolog [Argiope bruennichi]|uniref:testicular acid phosphatase homolog n=1 Tax=Argiope bruennichi TaxID=94029 RepID=UPI002493D95D|nr:testicular acid phosphatase homolog [Argiope bruennichi]